MELHHNAFGVRMYYQHPRCHHLPLLTTHQYAFFIIQLQSRGMGLLYKMQNLTKMMHIKCTNICANGTKLIIVHVLTKYVYESSLTSPNHRNFDEVDAFVF